jgi:hypothetical protein
MHAWLYILPIFAFLNLISKHSRKNVILAIASVVPGVFWTPYMMFHTVLIGTCLLTMYIYLLRKREGAKTGLTYLCLFLVCWLSLLALYFILGTSTQYSDVPARTLQEIYEQSLHPLMLVLPPVYTWWGHEGNKLLVSLVPRANSTNLYIGISTVLLAMLSAILLLRQKFNLTKSGKNLMIVSWLILLLCFVFSLPPTIHILIDIPTPSSLIANYVPSLRAGQRLVMPIMVMMLIIASAAVAYTDAYWKGNLKMKFGTFLIFILFVAFDLSIKPPELTAPLPKSSVSETIKKSPAGLVAQYINGSLTGDPSQTPCKFYLIHKHPIINYCGLEINYPKGQLQTIHQLNLLGINEQSKQLKKLGVDYIIIENEQNNLIKYYSSGDSGYKFQYRDPTHTLFTLAK